MPPAPWHGYFAILARLMPPFAFAQPSRQHGRLFRALVWLCALAFTWQVLAATAHRHDLAERVNDCVSCHISASLQGGVPPALPALAPAGPAILLYLALSAAVAACFAAPRYLFPPRQAPPARPAAV
jgi:hypothetical protein